MTRPINRLGPLTFDIHVVCVLVSDETAVLAGYEPAAVVDHLVAVHTLLGPEVVLAEP